MNWAASVDFQTWTGPVFSPGAMRELDGPLLAGHDDDRPIARLGIAQGHMAAAPGVRVDLPASAIDIDPARLGKLRGVGDRPDRRPDRVMPAPRRVGLHGAGVGPDDLVVDRVNGTPDLELGDAIARVELVHQPGQVERAFVAPLPAGLAPFLARPERLAGSLGFLRGVAAAFLVDLPRLAAIHVMVADRADQAVQLGVLFQRIEDLPELAVVVRCLEFHLGETHARPGSDAGFFRIQFRSVPISFWAAAIQSSSSP